jgi:hypothetical protein
MENLFEKKITERLKKKGWYNIKMGLTNRPGMPDRQYLKNGRSFFIEFKDVDGTLSPLQEYRIKELRAIGFHVLVLHRPAPIKS